MDEQWVSAQYIYSDGRIETFGDRYEVSDLGRIRSWVVRGRGSGEKAVTPHMLKERIGTTGYPCIHLAPLGKKSTPFKIHRVVLSSFRPDDWFKDAQVCHGQRTMDNSKLAKDLANLSWGTSSQNCLDTSRRDKLGIGENQYAAYPLAWIEDILQRIDAGQFPILCKRKDGTSPFSTTSARNWFNSTYEVQTTRGTITAWYSGINRFDVRREFADGEY